MYFKREKLTLMMPKQDLPNMVREPLDAKEATQLLEYLGKWKGKVSKNWKVRANANQVTLDSGDPFAYAEVYKGLSELEKEGALRAADIQHMNRSLELLVDELANALGKTPDEARDQITSV